MKPEFIEQLKRARAAVVKGNTGCEGQHPAAAWCLRCAMCNRASADGQRFWKWTFPHNADWSMYKTRDEVLAVFDASIKDAKRELRKVQREGTTPPSEDCSTKENK